MRRLRRILPWQRAMVVFGLLVAGGSIWWGVSTALSEASDDREPVGPTTTTLSGDVVAERRALERYEEAVEEIAYEAGRVVVQGLRAGLGELSRDEVDDDEAFAERAAAWGRQLANLRADLEAVEPPGFLAEAHQIRLDAMNGYISTAALLQQATGVTGAEREQRIDEVVESGETSDDVWEQADAVVDRHRERLGLPVTTLPGEVVEPDE